MNGRTWLDRYSGQSVDELISLADDYRIDSLVSAFEQAVWQKEASVGMASLTSEERVILAIEELEREVNNGGYVQFFSNPSQEFVPIIVECLKRIECPLTAAITQKAIDMLEVEGPVTVQGVEDAIMRDDDERDEKLCSECDVPYYKTGEDIAGCLFDFIKKNKGKILPRHDS